MTQHEQIIYNYYESKGYEVYYVELWDEDGLFKRDEGTFYDIEIGGSMEKYQHMRGYLSQDRLEALYKKVGIKA